ncbi:hypothetical protein GIY62_26515 [Burkholderia plantarii]|uniref:hypothetical protein n=1 Tax=Burkholderia plantarii TaxID=41899 RepID=UPI002729E7D9|nr:hypothetical protein [Burkholderia plantarii]WLE64091.1 hypothetical protein GIY62_26515 [Burkholderia plantarii]
MRSTARPAMPAGGGVNPAAIARLGAHGRDADADARQQAVTAVRRIFQGRPRIAAMMFMLAHWRRDERWRSVRSPLAARGARRGGRRATAGRTRRGRLRDAGARRARATRRHGEPPAANAGTDAAASATPTQTQTRTTTTQSEAGSTP